MTAETPPDRRPLATFLQDEQGTTNDAPSTGSGGESPVASDAAVAETVEAVAVSHEEENAAPPAAAEPQAPAATPTAAPPQFLRGPRPRVRAPRWQAGLVVALGVLLLVQIAVADRARLAADARTRPLVSALCTVLRCTLPAWREPAAYTMLQREVRPLASQPGVLQVQASFRNDARWAQDWPALRLSLSDADGRVIGRRTLQPGDYLPAAQGAPPALESGQSAQVAFLLREPSAATVAYTFEFR